MKTLIILLVFFGFNANGQSIAALNKILSKNKKSNRCVVKVDHSLDKFEAITNKPGSLSMQIDSASMLIFKAGYFPSEEPEEGVNEKKGTIGVQSIKRQMKYYKQCNFYKIPLLIVDQKDTTFYVVYNNKAFTLNDFLKLK